MVSFIVFLLLFLLAFTSVRAKSDDAQAQRPYGSDASVVIDKYAVAEIDGVSFLSRSMRVVGVVSISAVWTIKQQECVGKR